jgi:hypothetical protein
MRWPGFVQCTTKLEKNQFKIRNNAGNPSCLWKLNAERIQQVKSNKEVKINQETTVLTDAPRVRNCHQTRAAASIAPRNRYQLDSKLLFPIACTPLTERLITTIDGLNAALLQKGVPIKPYDHITL